MRLGVRGRNTKDSGPIGRIEGDQRMYDCYGKPSAAKVGGFACPWWAGVSLRDQGAEECGGLGARETAQRGPIRSTFDRRQTSVPVIPPAALTAKFHSEPVHVRQWAAFVRRIGEPALANEFSRFLADLAEFLMPAAKAAARSAEDPVRWEPPGTWQHGRSSKI
jgi:hypothetical protein